MDSTELVFALAIAMLFPFFFNKLSNRVTGYDDISTMCDSLYPSFYRIREPNEPKTEYDTCLEEKDKKLKDAEFHKHLVLIAVALIGLVISGVIQTKSTKVGVGLGSIITLIMALFMYWHRYNETYKLIVLGLSLLFVMYFSVRLYRINSIEDIFTVEYGTK